MVSLKRSLQKKWRKKSIYLVWLGSTLAVVLVLVPLLLAPYSSAQTLAWSKAVNISNTTASSWFPALTVDNAGRVHVVWTENSRDERQRLATDSLLYTMWDGESWSALNDLYTSTQASAYTLRPSIITDRADTLHVLYRYPAIIYHISASAESARSARAWSTPHRISGSGESNLADIAIDSKGVLHAVWSEQVVYSPSESERQLTSDVFYRRSADGGGTWSFPQDLSQSESPVGNSLHLHIDAQDVIHVVWDEEQSCGYVSSSDGGETWSRRVTFYSNAGSPRQIVAGVDGEGKILVVWRTASESTMMDEQLPIYYQLSSDGGFSWSAPAPIPNLLARALNDTPWDTYDMAVDSAGHAHLVVVGRTDSTDTALSVLHTEWDGSTWSSPTKIFTMGFPERPAITISRGNQLHVVWFVRDVLFAEGGSYEVWYSRGQSAAPSVSPPPSPTPLPTPTTTPTPVLSPSPTPYPTLATGTGGLPTGLYTESDEVLQLAVALLPLILLVLLTMVVKRGWLGRLFR